MDRYAEVHKSPNGVGDARPTAEQVVEDSGLAGKLAGRTVLITGGTAGLGTETARVLQMNGAKVFITARTAEKGEETASALNATSPSAPPVEVVVMDLGSLDSVRAAAAAFRSKSAQLHVLVNNAGVMSCPEGRTVDGVETQFGVNHVAHFLLFQLLKDTLLSSSSPPLRSRVVALASSGHRYSDMHWDDISLEASYDPWTAYSQSKTANVLFANELDRRYGAQGVHGLAVHPGLIPGTDLGRHLGDMPPAQLEALLADPQLKTLGKSVPQGAATQVWAAVAKELEGTGALYLEDVGVGKEVPADTAMFAAGFRPHIWNEESAARLWKESLRLVGMGAE